VLNLRPVDLLITDLCMPGISGLELIRQTQVFSPQTRTILITAYGDGKTEVEAHRLAVRYYIAKPFRLEVLLNAVEGILAD
jgi:DNA-binding NtrC family response regulator